MTSAASRQPSAVSPQHSALRTEVQARLPLGDVISDDTSLRAAFQRLDLQRVCKMTFEQFVANPARRVSLANAIEARLRARTEAGRA